MPSRTYAAELVATAEAEARRAGAATRSRPKSRTALGAIGTGKGTAGACAAAARRHQDLEKRRVPPARPGRRGTLARPRLIDLATHFRTPCCCQRGGSGDEPSPDMSRSGRRAADHASPERLLRCIEAVPRRVRRWPSTSSRSSPSTPWSPPSVNPAPDVPVVSPRFGRSARHELSAAPARPGTPPAQSVERLALVM